MAKWHRQDGVDGVEYSIVHTGGYQGAVTPDKEAIEPQEALELHPVSRVGPIHHRSHLLGIYLHTPCGEDETQKRDGGMLELTLLCFYKQLVLQEELKNLSDVEHMFLSGTGEDEDVI